MDSSEKPTYGTEEGPKAAPKENPEELLATLKKDLDRIKGQKARPTGGIEGTTLVNLCMLHDEQHVSYKKKQLALEPQDENKLQLTFNLIGPRFNKLLGRLSAFNAPFKARPNKKDPQALEEAEIVDRLNVALDEKLDQPSRLREILYWMGVSGTAFEFVPWIPNATTEPSPVFENGELMFKDLANPDPNAPPIPQSEVDQAVRSGLPVEQFQILEEVQIQGEVGSQIFGPLNVFIDQNVRSVQDLPPGSWVHVAEFKTVGWIEENYGETVEPQKDLSLISSRIKAEGESSGGTYLKDLIPLVQGSCDANDPKMVLHVQSFQPATQSRPHGRYVCWIPDQRILHDDDNPYEEIPLIDYHWSPVTTSFWTKSFITPLVAPQRFINKRMSQLGEQANATIYSTLLLDAGLDADDIPTDFPGVVENGLQDGNPRVARLPGPDMPNWFLQSIELAVKMFNDAAGGADLMEESKFPGQLRGPMAVPMLQEILDTQWGPLFNHLGERLARAKQMRLNRVKQFYPPQRTMHYTDRTQRDEVMTFHTEKVLRGGTNFNITVERGSILPELRSLREARLLERLNGPLSILYMDERTGQLDKSKIAADLQFGDAGREGREAMHRKLAIEIIKMIWEGKNPLPPVQPFYDHKCFLDELEAAMTTTEFITASPQIQQAFSQRWQEHNQYLQQQAMQQQMGMQSSMIQGAVAQATQMAAAKAAAEAVDSVHMQNQAQASQPTEQYVASAHAQSEGNPREKPQNKPQPKKTKMTIEREH